MRQYRTTIFLIAALAILSVGCSSTPDWVLKQSAAFDDAGVSALYGVGVAHKTPNVSATRTKAEARARTELAKQIRTWATSVTKDFVKEHRDYYANSASASSVEYYESIAVNVADATLVGATVVESYDDADANQWYALVKMDINQGFLDSYRKAAAKAAESSVSGVDIDKISDLLKDLDAMLATQYK